MACVLIVLHSKSLYTQRVPCGLHPACHLARTLNRLGVGETHCCKYNITQRSLKGATLLRAGCFKENTSQTQKESIASVIVLWCFVWCNYYIIGSFCIWVVDLWGLELLSSLFWTFSTRIGVPSLLDLVMYSNVFVYQSHLFPHSDFHATLSPRVRRGIASKRWGVLFHWGRPVRAGAFLEPFGRQAQNVGQPPTSLKIYPLTLKKS